MDGKRLVLGKPKDKLFSFLKVALTIFMVGLVFYPLIAMVSEALKFWDSSSPLKDQLNTKWLSSLSFTVSISALSAFLSLLLGGLNLYWLRRSVSHVGKLSLGILFLPSGIATIVSTLSFLVFFGNQGLLRDLLNSLGLENTWDSRGLYSYGMLTFLNVLYNLPIATLTLWGVSEYFPRPYLQKAQILGANLRQRFTSILLPLWRPHFLASFCLVFVYCFVSFFPVLFLGNKLELKTPEVLIYEQISWSFSMPSASWIALLQIGLLWALLSLFLAQKPLYAPFHKDPLEPEPYTKSWGSTAGSLILSGITSLLWLPLLIKAFSLPWARLWTSLIESWGAISNSLIIASFSGFFTVIFSAWLFFTYPRFLSKRRSYWLIFLPFTFSPLLTSLFYQNLLRVWLGNPSPYLGLVISQVVLGLPLVLYFLSRELGSFQDLPLRAKTLGARGFSRWLSLDLPLFRTTYLRVFFLSFMASLGNLSTGLLYLPEGFETLPLRINRLLGFYRVEEAIVVASLFVLLFFCLLGAYLWTARIFKRFN